MGIFQQFPYTNFHEFNLDEIIKILREMQDEWTATKAEWASYKAFIDHYFENLDVSDEVLRAMRIFAEDGTLNDIIDPTIATETAAWLADHITQPTTPAIDTSLTVAGAAADAEAAGIAIDKVRFIVNETGESRFRQEFNVLDYIDKADDSRAGVDYEWTPEGCHMSGTSTATTFTRLFYKNAEMPEFLEPGMPVIAKIESTNPNSLVKFDIFPIVNSTLQTNILGITSSYDGFGINYVTIPANTEGLMIRISLQALVTVDEYVRVSIMPQISASNVPNSQNKIMYDANSYARNGVYFISTGVQNDPVNFPYHSAGWLYVENIGQKDNVATLQVFYPFNSSAHDIMYRTRMLGVWNTWKALGSGGSGGGGTVIENTYNITTSPTITTDDHNWLVPVDTESASDAGKTDMTGAIMSLLTSTGHCHLAPGIFYVSGNIDMPEGSTLVGCGEDTIIRLLTSSTSAYIVRASQYNTVRDIRFSGGYSAPNISGDTVGTRHGIAYVGNSDGSTPAVPDALPSVVNSCWFENFSGAGIYCNNSGTSVHQALMVSDCYINNCMAGIDIAYRSEYLKFDNVVIRKCHYACINNGGNNTFTGCTFHGTIGFIMNNMYNSGHGSCIGCTFNHIDSWNDPAGLGGGTAIKADNISNGFVFSDCQIWFAKVEIINSRGISINNTQFGGSTPVITISGNYGAFFNGCIFHASPNITKNSATRFNNCYLDSSSGIIS